jgi:hypothetical protein
MNFVEFAGPDAANSTKFVTVTPPELAGAMFDMDRRLNSHLVRHKGLLVRRGAYDDGVPRHIIDSRVDGGVLLVVHEGVLRHAAVPMTTDMRWLAAVLAAGPDAALFGRAAGALHGFPTIRRTRPEVVSPHTDLPILHGVDVHRAVRLRPFERTTVRGIPVTSKGKTALDLCWLLPFAIAQEAIAQAVITKVVSPLDIITTLERSTGRGIRGTTKLRTVGLSLDELVGLESVLELDGAREIEIARVPRPVRQFELVCGDGRKVRMDLAWPEYRLGLDWNGKQWHATPASKLRTKQRHESIVASDWGHLMYGWTHVHDTPAEMRHEVETEIDLRRRWAA